MAADVFTRGDGRGSVETRRHPVLDVRYRTLWAEFFNTDWAAKILLDHRYLDDDAWAVATQMFHARGADDADVDYIRLGFLCVLDFPCALFPTTSPP